MSPDTIRYIGRFAPSPTGPLHQGSLFTALASFLDARHHNGQWLVRMEDLDPPREQPGAASEILKTLETHKLCWDGTVIYQSQRQHAYSEALQQLESAGLTYPCGCNRRRLRQMTVYDGRCLRYGCRATHQAIRLKIPPTQPIGVEYDDLMRGFQHHQLRTETGDFIIRRKDGLFAYQLAVVVDDIAQKITHIIRGSDLLDSAPRQRLLFHLLGAETIPFMGHLPILVNREHQKLSKQTFAQPIDNEQAGTNLWRALQQLGMQPPAPLLGCGCEELLAWAIPNWKRANIPAVDSIEVGN